MLVLLAGTSVTARASVIDAPPEADRECGGGFCSENVEFVGNVPEVAAAAASFRGRYLYITNQHSLSIYDARDPANPVSLAKREFGNGPYIGDANPPTNGRILLMSVTHPDQVVPDGEGDGRLVIVDVSEKSDPQKLAELALELAEPVWTCILDCRWAYGAWQGTIVDLRDPTHPRVLETRWSDAVTLNPPPFGQTPTHSLQEVRPGIVLTGSSPMYLLDARVNPARPRVLGVSDGSQYSWGGVDWPLQGRSRYALSFNLSGYYHHRCEANSVAAGTTLESAFATWDTRPWRRDEHIRVVDHYYLQNGTQADGSPIAGSCVPGWFDPHPDYARNGIVAITSPGHGVRFVRVDDVGQIEEIGHFLPHGGSVYDGQWVSDRIFYSIDIVRGIDILRFSGDA